MSEEGDPAVPPACWRLVSTAPLDAGAVRRLVGDETGGGETGGDETGGGDGVEVVVVDPRTERAAADAVAGADIVLGDYSFEVPITRRVIERMDRCRLIQQPSVGYQQIDVEAATERGIPVANAAGGNDAAVAEHTVMVGLMLLKQALWLDREVRRGRWPQLEVSARGHFELAGKVWGVVGFGRVGQQVARRLRGWDVDVRYFDPVPAAAAEDELGARRVDDLGDLLEAADVVSLHVPLTHATRHVVDERTLGRMRSGAYLINVARGEIVDEGALVRALRDGAIKGAALDVFAEEPLPPDHPLLDLDDVILTPHTAGTPIEAKVRIIKMTAENIRRVVRGEEPHHVVNDPAP